MTGTLPRHHHRRRLRNALLALACMLAYALPGWVEAAIPPVPHRAKKVKAAAYKKQIKPGRTLAAHPPAQRRPQKTHPRKPLAARPALLLTAHSATPVRISPPAPDEPRLAMSATLTEAQETALRPSVTVAPERQRIAPNVEVIAPPHPANSAKTFCVRNGQMVLTTHCNDPQESPAEARPPEVPKER